MQILNFTDIQAMLRFSPLTEQENVVNGTCNFLAHLAENEQI